MIFKGLAQVPKALYMALQDLMGPFKVDDGANDGKT